MCRYALDTPFFHFKAFVSVGRSSRCVSILLVIDGGGRCIPEQTSTVEVTRGRAALPIFFFFFSTKEQSNVNENRVRQKSMFAHAVRPARRVPSCPLLRPLPKAVWKRRDASECVMMEMKNEASRHRVYIDQTIV